MALPALGWKVQVWVPCAPTLTSSHCCHASSLREKQGASQPHCGGPTPLAHCQPALVLGCGTLSRAGGPWDVLPLHLSTRSPTCPLPCASPAQRRPVEELVGAVGLCGVPDPLAAHVLQVRGAAAQPDVSWAGENQGREGAASPLGPQSLDAAPCLPQDLHPSQPQVRVPPRCACQHPSGGDGRSPEERGVSAATACDQGPQTPSMEVPSGLLRTWMWYLTPGCRSWRTTQVLAWMSPCRRGDRLRSGCGP